MALISLFSFAGGTAVSCMADRLPMEKDRAELLGGLLLVIGLVIVGHGLSPIIR